CARRAYGSSYFFDYW
nr:immunoglobulin heavy chain junction region [Macaca mulatta]MOY23856.1 immunoglobulin heavy chain junction region [Macaca mulatta]MOY24755.1 immunoglobulin heavy chain junction region [Macaca mulatta]MOY24903.1 immunoglobulin heavy chain junction region [Macaca mulatta]MOY26911.1 immunoglobulin heavy chain junction region [Macaca mulatta]